MRKLPSNREKAGTIPTRIILSWVWCLRPSKRLILRPCREEIAQAIAADRHHSANRTVLDRVVQGYAGEDNPFGGQDRMLREGKMIINPQFEWTGGGYASTSADLARWARAFYEGRAFDASLMPQVLDGVEAPMLGRGAKYGLGTIIRSSSKAQSYGHSGFFPGYMTEMMYFPDRRLAIAVQVNSSVPKDLGSLSHAS